MATINLLRCKINQLRNKFICQYFLDILVIFQIQIKASMECSSMVSMAAFGPEDFGSNPGWLAVSNSNKKQSITNNTGMQYSSKYLNPVIGDILVGVNKQILKQQYRQTSPSIRINLEQFYLERLITLLDLFT